MPPLKCALSSTSLKKGGGGVAVLRSNTSPTAPTTSLRGGLLGQEVVRWKKPES